MVSKIFLPLYFFFVFEYTEKQHVGKKWSSTQVGEFPLCSPSLPKSSTCSRTEERTTQRGQYFASHQQEIVLDAILNSSNYYSGKKYNLLFHEFIKQLLDIIKKRNM